MKYILCKKKSKNTQIIINSTRKTHIPNINNYTGETMTKLTSRYGGKIQEQKVDFNDRTFSSRPTSNEYFPVTQQIWNWYENSGVTLLNIRI